jgi:AraC family transcriptional regulator
VHGNFMTWLVSSPVQLDEIMAAMNHGKLGIRLQVDPPGVLETAAQPNPHIVIHVGLPVEIGCERGGQMHRGLSVHGDVDIIPAGVASRWILKKQDCALVVRVSQDLLTEAAEDLGIDPYEAVLLNRFQVRDPEIEHLGWALKAELDHGQGSGRLFTDCIGMALACRLLRRHSLVAPRKEAARPGTMPSFRLRRALGYIEDNLSADVSLGAIAAASGLSVSHCQRAFRKSVGFSVHQYVIQRRIERAKSLLVDKDLSIGEVALAAGFSHQSHLAYHMRRLLGLSPMSVREPRD